MAAGAYIFVVKVYRIGFTEGYQKAAIEFTQLQPKRIR